MDMDKKEATGLMAESILFWSTHRDEEADQPTRRLPAYYDPSDDGWTQGQKGEDRLDDLIGKIGHDIAVSHIMEQWKRVESGLALFASELRFRVFKDPEDAFRAAANMVATFLWAANYIVRPEMSRKAFIDEFIRLLKGRLVHDTGLVACIRKYFKRP